MKFYNNSLTGTLRFFSEGHLVLYFIIIGSNDSVSSRCCLAVSSYNFV